MTAALPAPISLAPTAAAATSGSDEPVTVRVFDTESGAQHKSLPLYRHATVRELLPLLALRFFLPPGANVGVYLQRGVGVVEAKARYRVQAHQALYPAWSTLCAACGGADGVRLMLLDNAKFAATAMTWSDDWSRGAR